MNLVEELENLIETWNERRIYMGEQAKEAFDIKDMARQATLINNMKQVTNSIQDLRVVLDKEKARDKNWGAFMKDSRKRLEHVLNAGRMY